MILYGMLKITSKIFLLYQRGGPKGKRRANYLFFLQQSLSNPKTVIFHFANLMNEKNERVKPLPSPFPSLVFNIRRSLMNLIYKRSLIIQIKINKPNYF